jgi:hypothetical protein
MTFYPVTNPTNTILFVAIDQDQDGVKSVAAVYELDLTENARESFHWWFGAIRDANPGATIDITRAN